MTASEPVLGDALTVVLRVSRVAYRAESEQYALPPRSAFVLGGWNDRGSADVERR